MGVGQATVQTLGGAALGAGISVITNNALIEISLNSGFAFLFGLSLFIFGGAIIWRVYSLEKSSNSLSTMVGLFGLLVSISGICCFVVDKNLVKGLSSPQKVPLYTILGVSLSFSLVFAIVDLCNFFSDSLSDIPLPRVIHHRQVVIVLVGAVIMGSIYGLLFGLAAPQDEDKFSQHPIFHHVEQITVVAGGVVGALVGLLSHVTSDRSRSSAFHRIDREMGDLYGGF
eukprot:c216_g1_i1.p1 GENE.c216_g1_i1~~c216_g1_i1.p1  ORF type:complete len:228 (+),score=48.12 c216_g1_i1:53-736(+)